MAIFSLIDRGFKGISNISFNCKKRSTADPYRPRSTWLFPIACPVSNQSIKIEILFLSEFQIFRASHQICMFTSSTFIF